MDKYVRRNFPYGWEPIPAETFQGAAGALVTIVTEATTKVKTTATAVLAPRQEGEKEGGGLPAPVSHIRDIGKYSTSR